MYMDETWVNQNHCTDYMWLPNDGSDASNIPSGKGKRLIVLHAGTRSEGLIDGWDLVFLAKSKDGDYHQEMNSVVFLEWFENQLRPALKNPSLVVLDNASHHNVKTDDTVCPNCSQKKSCSPKLSYTTQRSLFILYIIRKCMQYKPSITSNIEMYWGRYIVCL